MTVASEGTERQPGCDCECGCCKPAEPPSHREQEPSTAAD